MNNSDLKAYREYFPSGQLKTEWFEKEGKLEGWRRRWFDGGQIFTETEFHDGQTNGVIREWTEDGTLVLMANTENGDFHGNYQSWWDDGIRKEEGVYFRGKPTKGYRWYRINGDFWKERAESQSPVDDGPPAWSENDVK